MDRPKADSVLVLSGLDPSGAAGIAADIETINQFGLNSASNNYSINCSKYSKSRSIRSYKK